MRDRRKRPVVREDEPRSEKRDSAQAGARYEAPVKLTEEDIRKLVEVFLILGRWKREDDEKAVVERGE